MAKAESELRRLYLRECAASIREALQSLKVARFWTDSAADVSKMGLILDRLEEAVLIADDIAEEVPR